MTTAARTVATNIRLLRRQRGWTQTEAAERFLGCGYEWSKATWSAMERSAENHRVRTFTADELVALADLFNASVGDLFDDPARLMPCPLCHGRGLVEETPDA